jgi:hypothetical protein
MTAAPAETRTDPVAAVRWGWVGLVVLAALWTVAHIGCHGDDDNELGVSPPVERRVETIFRHDGGPDPGLTA